jgi:hypothetical protein
MPNLGDGCDHAGVVRFSRDWLNTKRNIFALASPKPLWLLARYEDFNFQKLLAHFRSLAPRKGNFPSMAKAAAGGQDAMELSRQ